MPTSNNQIQRVRELIKSGRKQQAVILLTRMIERDHDNTELWWLLANSTDNIGRARRALEEVLELNPRDQRAEQMLRRLEARQKLRQMGLNHVDERAQHRRRRAMLFVLGGSAVLTIVAAGVIAGSGLLNREEVPLPTAVVMNTAVPTVAVTEFFVEKTAEVVAALPTAVPTEKVDVVLPSERPTEVKVNPTIPATEEINPEATEDAVPLETQSEPLSNPTSETLVPPPILPESTEDVSAQGAGGTGTSNGLASSESVSDMRGQVLDGIARREIIAPYGVQGWTFSGYRAEKVQLELVNVTGTGNPSLELRDESGRTVASDIDMINGGRTTSQLEITLPSDGIYTVVVRMAAMEEQLYSLTLSRIQ